MDYSQTPNSASNPLPPSGFCFAVAEVALACRAWGPQLKPYVPAPLDPVQLMWAFANKESTHDHEGFFGCEPRFEPAYFGSGWYARQPPMPALIEAYGKDAAKSYGPWQVMFCNAAKWRPEDFKYLDICAESFVTYLSNRCRIHRPANLDEFGQLYNGGHIVAKPALPNAQVLEYCHHLNEWYKIAIPEEL